MQKKVAAYKNNSLKDLKGEEWRDMPKLDGYFLISNYGRIKRLQYEMQYRNGAIYVKPEKIIKPGITRGFNKFKKDYIYCLTGAVTLGGKKYCFTVARMVYFCFVEPFELEDSNIVILCKDANNFNIHPSNLQMATQGQRLQRAVDRKRFRSPFYDVPEQDRLNQRNALLKKFNKQVTQYSLNGAKIATYPSAAQAERATGVFATSIGKIASGEGVTAGGFIWRWGCEPKVDVAAFKQEKRKAYVEKHGQKLTQYSLSGKRIACFPCIRDAAEASGALGQAILKVLKGEYKSAKGFFWKKGYGEKKIDLSNYKYGRESMAITQSKPVKQYSPNGRYIQTFPSVKLAAQSIGVCPATIIGALKGRQHTCGGFRWQYV